MDSSKLPIGKKKKLSEMKTSASERRKKWNPRKWAKKYLRDGGGLPATVSMSEIVDHPGVICTICKTERFAEPYGFPDPETFVCDSCAIEAKRNKDAKNSQ